VFLLNKRLEHSWHVARFDYWRWHFIMTCQVCGPWETVTTLWETEDEKIVAVLNPIGMGELRLHVHPHFRTPQLEDEMFARAEEHLFLQDEQGRHIIYLPVDTDDTLRQETLACRAYKKGSNISHKWHRDLDAPLPDAPVPSGYIIRSMGAIDEHPARGLASWRSFHSDEPETNYDGDWSWFQNLQSAPLYRRDLDIVAAAPGGELAAFCTIFYDDTTRSAVCVLVGTAAEHWRRGLGKAVIVEGMRRLQKLGCTRVFATAYDPPANALYGSVMQTCQVSETWYKELPHKG
jgi:GNAT superfamily N-acetyltransferase